MLIGLKNHNTGEMSGIEITQHDMDALRNALKGDNLEVNHVRITAWKLGSRENE